MRTHIALLKGINVGGRNKVPMADLKALFVALGYTEPATLLQSGNVAFGSSHSSDDRLEELLQKELELAMGLSIEFHVRGAAELRSVIAENPLPREAEVDPSHLLVHFFRSPLDPVAVEAVQSLVKGPELLRLRGRHLYVAYPDGIGTSTIGKTPGWNKLTANGTARNWNTLLKLASMCEV